MSPLIGRFPLPIAASLHDACEAAALQLLSDILLIHTAITVPIGTTPNLLSPQLLDSAAHRPFSMYGNEFLYQTGLEQAAALLESLTQNHAFEDGNKRTALTSCLYFLDRCGYWQHIGILTERESRELEELVLIIATKGTQIKQKKVPLPPSVDVPHIAQALDDILGPSRDRLVHPRRQLKDVFRRIGELFLPR